MHTSDRDAEWRWRRQAEQRVHRKTEIAEPSKDRDPHQEGARHRHKRPGRREAGGNKNKRKKSEGKMSEGKGVRCVGGEKEGRD